MRSVLALFLACSACKSTTAASREAWEKALHGGPGSTSGSTTGGSRGTSRGNGSGDSWQSLAQFATDAGELLAGGSTTVSLTRLAKQLCREVPADVDTEDPALPSLRGEPKNEVAALGHDLQLELGRPNAIGLVAPDLTDQASAELVRQTLQRLRGACKEAWTMVRADNALQELHTCPTASGATLSLGRFPSSSGQWHFSLAVLGPG